MLDSPPAVAIEFRPAVPSDRVAILGLFRTAFKSEPDPADLAWKYDANPHPAVSVVALEDGSLVGHIGALGTRYRGAGIDEKGNSLVDVMTHPGARALGKAALFKRLAEAFRQTNAAEGVHFDFGFPHARAQKIEERLGGCVAVEPCGERTRPLDAPSPVGRIRRRLLRVVEGAPFGRAHEGLAETLHARAGWRTDRSARSLAWRFSRPGYVYRTFQLLDLRGRSRGYAVVSVRFGKAFLVDFQVRSETDGTVADLVAALAERLAGADASRMVLRSPLEGFLGKRLAGELGFSPEPSDTVLLMHPAKEGFDFVTPGRSFDYRFLDHDVF